jgi:hypothetical protein
MPQTMIGLESLGQDQNAQYDDVESELCGSTREAYAAYFPSRAFVGTVLKARVDQPESSSPVVQVEGLAAPSASLR